MKRQHWQVLVGVILVLWSVGGLLGLGPAKGEAAGGGRAVVGHGDSRLQPAQPEVNLDTAPRIEGEGLAELFGKETFASNGEQIYYTGVSAKTGQVWSTGGPAWFRAGAYGCVACHGVHGQGGVPVTMEGPIPADIRYSALVTGQYDHAKQQADAYDSQAHIKRLVTSGIEPDGGQCDSTMPRWQMKESDLNDLIAYLKTFRR